jgi:hypothetical protein
MENNEVEGRLEDDVRQLAYSIWTSAGDEFGRAVDFWVMAEQMTVELAAASARLASATVVASTARHARSAALRSLYLYKIHELAHVMWDSAGQRYERSVDFWLAAERHIMALAESAARLAGSSVGAEAMVARAFETFSAVSHLEKVRETAYYMWEAAGRQYGDALEFWLEAERQVLEAGFAPADISPTPPSVEPEATPAKKPSRKGRPAAGRGGS